jgi:hypothetical protein
VAAGVTWTKTANPASQSPGAAQATFSNQAIGTNVTNVSLGVLDLAHMTASATASYAGLGGASSHIVSASWGP